MYGMAVVGALTAGVLGTVSLTHADTIIDIAPARVQAGTQVVIVGGQCPCFRWQVQAQVGAGRYETQDILISTEGLFQANLATPVGFQSLATSLFKAGAIEALVKGGHVGVGFNGVQFGGDSTRGLKSVLRTGLYALVNILQNDSLRLDGHVGYNWDQFTALAGASGSRGLIDQAISGRWEDGPWSAMFSAHVGLEADSHFADTSRMVFGATANVRVRMFTFDQFEAGLTAQVSGEHDGFLETLGLNPNYLTGSLLMDLTYLPDALHQHTN